MKLILEKEETIDGEKTFVKIKDISDIKEAKTGEWIHECHHDEDNPRPCKRYKK